MTEMKILDYGYLRLIETWGSDERIVEAARMSTGKGFLGWGDDSPCAWSFAAEADKRVCNRGIHNCPVDHVIGDEKLLRYLWAHKHATPFEMAGLIVEVQAPIFVFREWMRHRSQSFNEMSARYMPLPDVNYIPTIDRLMIGGGHLTKQAGTVAGADALTPDTAERYRHALAQIYANAQELYENALSMGVPKELARVHLPVGRYSRMRASANLRNWISFLTLRMDKAAQYEIRVYANAIGELIAQSFPRTWELFAEGR